jgi:hypothetical protein
MSAYFGRTVLHLVTITKWSTVQSRYADTNYYSTNLKYAEGYAECDELIATVVCRDLHHI